MLKIFTLLSLIALAYSGPVQGTFKELPCLGKLAGQRLAHPTNPHQFLRCVAADSAWIETCPDNLFYNPHSQICDWDTIEKVTSTTTTPAPEFEKRPVLVKFRPKTDTDHQFGTARGIETTIISDPTLLEMANTPRPDSVLTTSTPAVATTPVSTTTVVTVTTTPVLEFEITTPVSIIETTFLTSTQNINIVRPTTTPAAVFVQPVMDEVLTTPATPLVLTTPVAIPVQQQPIVQSIQQFMTAAPVTTQAPIVQQQTVAPIVAPVFQQPIIAPTVVPVFQQPIAATTVAPVFQQQTVATTVAPVFQQQTVTPVFQQPIVAPVVQQPLVAPVVQQPIVAPVVQPQLEILTMSTTARMVIG